jgi:hypothetical protein
LSPSTPREKHMNSLLQQERFPSFTKEIEEWFFHTEWKGRMVSRLSRTERNGRIDFFYTQGGGWMSCHDPKHERIANFHPNRRWWMSCH